MMVWVEGRRMEEEGQWEYTMAKTETHTADYYKLTSDYGRMKKGQNNKRTDPSTMRHDYRSWLIIDREHESIDALWAGLR